MEILSTRLAGRRRRKSRGNKSVGHARARPDIFALRKTKNLCLFIRKYRVVSVFRKRGGSGRHQTSLGSTSRTLPAQVKAKDLDIGLTRAVGSQTKDIGQ